MARLTGSNELRNPLDALPVLYEVLPPPPAAAVRPPTAVERALSWPISRTPANVLTVSFGVGALVTLGVWLVFRDVADSSPVPAAITLGVLSAIVTAGLIVFSDDQPKPIAQSQPTPPPIVLARMRSSVAIAFIADARADPRAAVSRLTALRTAWADLLAHAPPQTGKVKARPYIAAKAEWSWVAIARLAVYGAIVLSIAYTRSSFTLPFLLIFSVFVSLDIWSLSSGRAFRKRCLRALRDGVCPVCDYDLRGLEPACAALSALGPKRCPECAARWPVAPPVVADLERSSPT